MLPEISEIKRRRLRLGMKQLGLARASNVSQSLIAKIESGKINPSYDIAKRIFLALEHHERSEEKIAKDIMTKHIVSAVKNDTVQNVARLMKKHGISQVPVMEKNIIIGSISENAIMNHIGNGADLKIKISSIIEEPFPTVDENTPASLVKSILGYSPAVLVIKNSRPAGIITKSDILKMAK